MRSASYNMSTNANWLPRSSVLFIGWKMLMSLMVLLRSLNVLGPFIRLFRTPFFNTLEYCDDDARAARRNMPC